MSLEGLISGSECALPNNPLAQVLKHTESDRSVQRDRIAGPSSSRLQYLPSTSSVQASEHDVSLARQFFDPSVPSVPPAAFAQLRSLPNIAHGLDRASPMPQANLQDLWMQAEMQKHTAQVGMQQFHSQDAAWAAEFGDSMLKRMGPSGAGPITQPQPGASQDFLRSSYAPSQSLYQPSLDMGMGMYGMNMPQTFSPMQYQGKGKGKAREEALEAAFAQFADMQPQSSAKIEEVNDVVNLEGAMRNTSLDEKESIEELQEPVTSSDFQKVWEQLRNSEAPAAEEDLAKWESEFQQLMQAGREDLDFDYGTSMKEAWENGLGAYDGEGMMTPEHMKFDDEGVPILELYAFDADNKYLADPPSVSHLAEAKRLLENNGSLTEAALLLEAAIQKGELGKGGYETWILLGDTRSMDEREEAGMRALSEGVRASEEVGAGGAGMLSLAISFTNEGYDRGAHTMLMRWLRARFPNHNLPPGASESLKQTTWVSREAVTEAFLAIARQQHASGVVDPDVQTGLGVLFYNNGDYGRARDCFESALAVRPKDYLLWNRLGSSLSNGDKPEEALGAYREALQLRPTYTRAIYNVGVACLNIGADKEAAEHFLSALAMQETGSGEKSEQLWFTLRRALLSMDRGDLAEKAKAGGDLNLFRSEGFDF